MLPYTGSNALIQRRQIQSLIQSLRYVWQGNPVEKKAWFGSIFVLEAKKHSAINEKKVLYCLLAIVSIFGCSDSRELNESHHSIVLCYKSPGRSAEENETDVTRPVEKILQSLQLVKSINSASTENSVIISLEIPQTSNVENTIELVKNRLALKKTSLPLDIPDPMIFDSAESFGMCE